MTEFKNGDKLRFNTYKGDTLYWYVGKLPNGYHVLAWVDPEGDYSTGDTSDYALNTHYALWVDEPEVGKNYIGGPEFDRQMYDFHVYEIREGQVFGRERQRGEHGYWYGDGYTLEEFSKRFKVADGD